VYIKDLPLYFVSLNVLINKPFKFLQEDVLKIINVFLSQDALYGLVTAFFHCWPLFSPSLKPCTVRSGLQLSSIVLSLLPAFLFISQALHSTVLVCSFPPLLSPSYQPLFSSSLKPCTVRRYRYVSLLSLYLGFVYFLIYVHFLKHFLLKKCIVLSLLPLFSPKCRFLSSLYT
jgi:hypothetical protein